MSTNKEETFKIKFEDDYEFEDILTVSIDVFDYLSDKDDRYVVKTIIPTIINALRIEGLFSKEIKRTEASFKKIKKGAKEAGLKKDDRVLTVKLVFKA